MLSMIKTNFSKDKTSHTKRSCSIILHGEDTIHLSGKTKIEDDQG